MKKDLFEQKGVQILNFSNHNSGSLFVRDLPTYQYEATLLETPIGIKKPKINYKEYKNINGKRRLLVSQLNDGSIITRFDKTPLPQKATDVICPHFLELKWAYGCPFDCAWCLDGDTLILMGDLSWQKIKNIKREDIVVGVEKDKKSGYYKLKNSKVLAKHIRKDWAVKIITSKGEVICSKNHKWLTKSGRWRESEKLKIGWRIGWISGPFPNIGFSKMYKKGYLAGLIAGDGTRGIYKYTTRWKKWKKTYEQTFYKVKIAMKDRDCIDRAEEFGRELNINFNRTIINPGLNRFGKTKLEGLRIDGRLNYEKIDKILSGDLLNKEFARGFLAGMFDAEGYFQTNILRIYNENEKLLDDIESAIKTLSFRSIREERSIRLLGGISEIIRFLSTVRPVSKKIKNIEGISIDYQAKVIGKEEIGKRELVDIQTDTENFFANGMLSHNCYLKGTFRFRPEGIKPVIKDLEKVKLHVETFLEEVQEPEILNTGEIADSLMMENGISAFSKIIIPLFETQNKHKVLFVTKSTNIKNLLEIKPHNQAIVSFTLNALPVSELWEKKAPKVLDRIKVAEELSNAGYEVRIRVDPMVPVEDWGNLYQDLINKIFLRFRPERITFGSLRGLQSTINGTKDTSWVHYLKETSNWGKKIDFTTRLKMYSNIITYLKKKYRYDRIALCKETKAMWQKLGMDYKNIRCNCIW